jgi:phage tail protein X
MEEAIKDLTWSPFAPASAFPAQIPSQAIRNRRQLNTRPRPRRLALAAGLAFMAVIIFGVGLILGHSGLDWRDNISRLSQRVFQSKKISRAGGAGKIPVTTLPDDKVQGSTTQGVETKDARAEKVDTDPVPAKKDKAGSVPLKKFEADPVPAAAFKTADVPAKNVEATRISADSAKETGVVPEKIGSASFAAATQANSLPESASATEEPNEKAPQLAPKETTKESDASQAPKLTRQRLPLELAIRPGDTLASIIRQHYGSYNKETLRAVLHENPEIQNPDRILVGAILKLPLLSEKP